MTVAVTQGRWRPVDTLRVAAAPIPTRFPSPCPPAGAGLLAAGAAGAEGRSALASRCPVGPGRPGWSGACGGGRGGMGRGVGL